MRRVSTISRQIIKRYPNLIPKPLDEALTKMWAFASEHGRHICESRKPTLEVAELAVNIASGVCSYLARKNLASLPSPH
jgi:endonuclease III